MTVAFNGRTDEYFATYLFTLQFEGTTYGGKKVNYYICDKKYYINCWTGGFNLDDKKQTADTHFFEDMEINLEEIINDISNCFKHSSSEDYKHKPWEYLYDISKEGFLFLEKYCLQFLKIWAVNTHDYILKGKTLEEKENEALRNFKNKFLANSKTIK